MGVNGTQILLLSLNLLIGIYMILYVLPVKKVLNFKIRYLKNLIDGIKLSQSELKIRVTNLEENINLIKYGKQTMLFNNDNGSDLLERRFPDPDDTGDDSENPPIPPPPRGDEPDEDEEE